MGGLPHYGPDYDGNEIRDRPLINQMKSGGPTPALMTATFVARRHMIVAQNATIARMKKEFPGLFVEEEVSLFSAYYMDGMQANSARQFPPAAGSSLSETVRAAMVKSPHSSRLLKSLVVFNFLVRAYVYKACVSVGVH